MVPMIHSGIFEKLSQGPCYQIINISLRDILSVPTVVKGCRIKGGLDHLNHWKEQIIDQDCLL